MFQQVCGKVWVFQQVCGRVWVGVSAGVWKGMGGCFSRCVVGCRWVIQQVCVEGCGCFSGCGWAFQQVCGRVWVFQWVWVGLSAGVWKGEGGSFSRCVEKCGCFSGCGCVFQQVCGRVWVGLSAGLVWADVCEERCAGVGVCVCRGVCAQAGHNRRCRG